jgi:hypothetical protein
MTTALYPVLFDAPLVRPGNPYGLRAATSLSEESSPTAALRWLPSGVRVRGRNYGGENTFGIWNAPWAVSADDLTNDDIKTGTRTYTDLDPFAPMTAWAFARNECNEFGGLDLGPQTLALVRERASQTFATFEPLSIEDQFATRMLNDAENPLTAGDLVSAVGVLEEAFAATGTFGLVHARMGLLAVAQASRLLVRDQDSPGVLLTPAGHRWVFGGGYATPLGDTLIATSVTFGWREQQVNLREAIDYELTEFVAIAERSTLIGYEKSVAAVRITT